MTEPVNSLSFFEIHWTFWKLLGRGLPDVPYRMLCLAGILILHIAITFGYPFHLAMGLFRNANITDDLKNLTTAVTCGACSIKILIYAYKFDKVARMEQLLRELDARVSGQAQQKVFEDMKKQQRTIVISFTVVFLGCALFAEMAFFFQEGRGLMYPAWFPFEWRHNTRNYYVANVYQIVGVSYQLLENFVCDCFPAMVLCLISTHIKMLYIRFEQVGQDEQLTPEAHERQLEHCITDHKNLLDLAQTIESFMSIPMFIQLTVTALNVCIGIAGLLFFVTEPIPRTYFFFYSLAMPLEIFPTCYYGTDNEYWFGKLHYAAFVCNWLTQGRSFKKKLIFFVQRSLKKSTAMAGGMLRIHVDTFFSCLRFAYSLLAVMLQMRNK